MTMENVPVSREGSNIFVRWIHFMRTTDGLIASIVVIGVICIMLIQIFLAICQFYYRRRLNLNLERRGLLEGRRYHERPVFVIPSRVVVESMRKISPDECQSGTTIVEVHEDSSLVDVL